MAADTKKVTLTEEEIEQISREVNDFQDKSIKYASSSPALSAHYWRLYQASRPSLKRFDRMKRATENREAREKRKGARTGGKGASSTKA